MDNPGISSDICLYCYIYLSVRDISIYRIVDCVLCAKSYSKLRVFKKLPVWSKHIAHKHRMYIVV
jgi:hypothetical protein